MITDKLFPDFAVRVNKVITTMKDLHGMEMRVTDGLRSFYEQDNLYQQGRTVPGAVVTDAPAGKSFHEFGLAADLCFRGKYPYLENSSKEDHKFLWSEFARIGNMYGLLCGATFKRPDLDHLEKSYGLTLDQLKELYNKDGLSSIFSYINEVIKIK